MGNEESVAFFYGRETPGIVLSDELDVGKRDSEVAHSYRVVGARKDLAGKYWYDGEFNNVLFMTPAIEDDGVSFAGSSEFTVKIDPANRGVRLRRRLDKEINRQKANVYVDGRQVVERPWYTVDHDKTYRDIRWVDSDFEIPAKYTAGKSSITLKIENTAGAKGRGMSSTIGFSVIGRKSTVGCSLGWQLHCHPGRRHNCCLSSGSEINHSAPPVGQGTAGKKLCLKCLDRKIAD